MSATQSPRRHRGAARGFTLIEVMISILIFSLGVLGTLALQARAMQFSTQNADRSRASMLVGEIVSQMWALQTVSVDNATYTKWQTKVSTPSTSGLPNGSGTVSANVNTNTATVTVTWQPPSVSSSSTPNSYTTTVVIQ